MKPIPAHLDVQRMVVKQPYRCNHCRGTGWRMVSDGADDVQHDTCMACDGSAVLYTPWCLICGGVRDGDADPASCRCDRDTVSRHADTTGDFSIYLRKYADVVREVARIDYHVGERRRMHLGGMIHNVPRPAFDFIAAWLGVSDYSSEVVKKLSTDVWTVDLDLGVEEHPYHGTSLATNAPSALPLDVRRAWETQAVEVKR